MMRGVVGGDGIDGAVGKSFEEGVAIVARSERRVHFEARVVLDVFIDESEMMRRDFTCDSEATAFGFAHVFERAACREMRDVQSRAGKCGDFDVASRANRFGGGGHAFQAETN